MSNDFFNKTIAWQLGFLWYSLGMTKEAAEYIKASCEDAGHECEIRSDYSGRSMYGRETYAVVVDDFAQMFNDVIEHIRATVEVAEHTGDVNFPEIGLLRQDNMGRNSVVIY